MSEKDLFDKLRRTPYHEVMSEFRRNKKEINGTLDGAAQFLKKHGWTLPEWWAETLGVSLEPKNSKTSNE